MFWVLLLLAAALGAAYYRWSRRRLYRLARELPCGYKEYPILGHAYMLIGNSEDHMEVLQKIGRETNRQGGLASFWLSNKLFVNMTDPNAIDVVSKNCLEKDNFTMKILRTVTGNGTIFAPVSVWPPRRKVLAPVFNLKNLVRLMPIFQARSSLIADLMRAEVGSGDFPIWTYMSTYTFDSICESAMGVKINSQENTEHVIPRTIRELMHVACERMLKPWLHPDFIYKKLRVYKKFAQYRQDMNEFIDEVIQNKRNETTKDEPKDGDSDVSFLDMIIHNSGGDDGFTDFELREELIVMVIAGNDSSAATLSYTSVMLSRYPEVQEKLYRELQEVFGDTDRAVTADDLSRLKYMDAVIKESLRLYPPTPVVVREVQEDVVLPSGTTLMDGIAVLINIWGTHRNPSYWGADAELFRPERFLEGPLRHPAQFIPFSHSVRNCLGYTFALMSVKTALANMLRRYRLLPPANMTAADLTKPLRVKFEISMIAMDNYIVRVEERKK